MSKTKKYLRVGTMSDGEWNNKILPLVRAKTLKDRSKELPGGFLVYGQTMVALVEDTDGKVYRCVAWIGEHGLDVSLHIKETPGLV